MCLPPKHWDDRCTTRPGLFLCVGSGEERRSSCLQGKHFTNGAMTPDPKANFDLDQQRSSSSVSILFSLTPTTHPRHPSFRQLLKSSCCSLKTPRELQSWYLPIAFLCLWNAPGPDVFTAGSPHPVCSHVTDPLAPTCTHRSHYWALCLALVPTLLSMHLLICGPFHPIKCTDLRQDPCFIFHYSVRA